MKILLILLFTCTLNAQVITHISGAGEAEAGGSPVTITDDFSTDPASNWTNEVGTFTWDSGNENIDLDDASNLAVYNTTLTGNDGWAYVKLVAGQYHGIAFRYNGTVGYVVRYNASNAIVWRYCTGTSCSDIESVSPTDDSTPYYMCIRWAGAGDATVVEYWSKDTKPDNDPDTWGAAEETFTNNPGGNARDVGTQVGIYQGGETGTTLDDFGAGD